MTKKKKKKAKAPPKPPKLLQRGNAKLGDDIWTFSLPPVSTCPGATDWCKQRCYAVKVERRYHTARNAWARNMGEAALDLPRLEERLSDELDNLPYAAVVRIHVSGDFYSPEYAEMWYRLMLRNQYITKFFTYTRSWRIPAIWKVLRRMHEVGWVWIWCSTDPEIRDHELPKAEWGIPSLESLKNKRPRLRARWRQARMLPKGETSRKGYVTCPEQIGLQASCSTCTLCFNEDLREDARLAFIEH